ncbi:MAG: hypothetical protein H0U67_14730, partial [Gemmatimonadetes bacterium]|nr:hypothetical protein [Gemmatimonadota bacterium]
MDAGDAEGALALYRGDLLAGFNLSGAHGWDQWLDAERQNLRDRAAAAAWALGESAEGEGRASDAAAWARRAAGFTPEDEEPHRRLLALLDRIGDRSAAIRAHEEFSRRLAAEYELEPSVKTRVLVEAIRFKQEREEHGPAEEAAVRVRNPERRPPVLHHSPLPELLPTPAAGTGTSPKRLFPGRRTAAALAAVLLLVLVGGWWMGRESAPAQAAGSVSRVAILPFTVRGTSEWAYLSDGMVDLLSAKLDGAGRLRTVDPRALIGSLEVKGGVVDPELGRRFAARFDADLYLLGSVVSQGERLQLSAALYQ